MKTIRDQIRAWRMNKNLTEADVAGIFGLCEDTIAYWEKGGSLPKVQQMPRIIQMIGYIPVNIDTSNLAGRIKYYRIRRGKTQEELAKELGINESTGFHYEKGAHKPFVKTPDKLEALLSLPGEDKISCTQLCLRVCS